MYIYYFLLCVKYGVSDLVDMVSFCSARQVMQLREAVLPKL